jgi:hypothetical protein
LPEREALLAFDVRQLLAFVCRMRRDDAVGGVGAEHIKIAILEAALVEHVEGLGFILLHCGDCLVEVPY